MDRDAAIFCEALIAAGLGGPVSGIGPEPTKAPDPPRGASLLVGTLDPNGLRRSTELVCKAVGSLPPGDCLIAGKDRGDTPLNPEPPREGTGLNCAILGELENAGIGDKLFIDNVPGLGTAKGTIDLEGPDETIGKVPERMVGNLFTVVILGDGGKRLKLDNDDCMLLDALAETGLGVELKALADEPPIGGKADTKLAEMGPGDGAGENVLTVGTVGSGPLPNERRL